jgi:hypothetical protein
VEYVTDQPGHLEAHESHSGPSKPSLLQPYTTL